VLTNGQRELRDSIKSDEPSDTRHFVPMREDALHTYDNRFERTNRSIKKIYRNFG
jgi:hypothetical protein